MARTVSLHKKDIVLNRENLNKILEKRGMTFVSFYEKVSDRYGLDLTYKGFMSLMSNRSSWKLLYAFAMTDVLNISVNDIFDVVDVDIEKKIKEKEEWKDKYERKKNR